MWSVQTRAALTDDVSSCLEINLYAGDVFAPSMQRPVDVADDAPSPLDVEMEKRNATVKEEDIQAVRGALQARAGAHVDPGVDLIHMYLRATSNNIAHVRSPLVYEKAHW